MKRSSVYCRVKNPARITDCSFGASGGFYADIRVGWGSSDSHTLDEIEVSEHIESGKKVFSLWINGEKFASAVHKKGELEFTIQRFTPCQLHEPYWRE